MAETTENIIQVRNLSVEFRTDEGTIRAVKSISFDIPRGKTVGLVGESGSGKSVTSLAVMRLIPNPPGKITSGEILFNGSDLLKKSESEMRIMIEICASRDDPVHEARLHERNQARLAQPGRRQRAGQAHADVAVLRQHFVRQQFGGLAEAPAVVGQKSLVDQVGGGDVAAHSQRVETRVGGELS